MHRTDSARVSVSSLVTHYAYRHHRQQHRKRLPYLGIESGATDFIDYDVISFLEQSDAFRRDFSQDAHGQSGAGERLALQNFFRHSHFPANATDFILKQIL